MSEDKKQLQAYYTAVSKALDNEYSPNQLAVIQNSVAKNTSAAELAYFLNVCKTMQLNPFNKEVWCYKDNRGNLLIFAGRDGFLSKAQKNPNYNGIRSIEICENDEYSLDILNNKIHHVIKAPKKERGAILYGVSIVFRKDGEPTIEIADFNTYNKGYNAWKTHPDEMIKKVAECHALKKAFGISGIQSEYDYNVREGVAVPNRVKQDDLQTLVELFEQHKDILSSQDFDIIQNVIDTKEQASYAKLIKELQKL